MPGLPRHIIQRGNHHSACFYTDDDYHKYLDTLKEQTIKYDCLIHVYCLMSNHVHLLLTPQHEDSASLLMKYFCQRYVQYVNRTYKRCGTLWPFSHISVLQGFHTSCTSEGRYHSCLTQSEDYVLGSERFKEEIDNMLKRRVSPAKAGRPVKESVN